VSDNDNDNDNQASEPPVEDSKELATTPNDDDFSDILSEIKNAPSEVRQQMMSNLSMSFIESRTSRRASNPLFEKMTEGHIDKYLDYIQRDDDNEYELRRTNRKYYIFIFVFSLIFLAVSVAYLLPIDKEFLLTFLQILVAVAGGIGAGYGLKSR
jgi:hypothetical protein